MVTDMGKGQETKNIICVTNERRNAKRKSSKESMTDSYEIMNSVSEWLNIIEMKKFVDDGMFLQMKITLIICQKKEYFCYKNKWWLHSKKSGSDTLPLRNRFDIKQALSTLERLQQEAGEEPFLPTYSYKHKQWQSHRVRPLHGGNGKIPGGLLEIQKVKEEANKVLGMNGETRFLHYFGENLRRWLSIIQFILLQIGRLQLTVVYCNPRGV